MATVMAALSRLMPILRHLHLCLNRPRRWRDVRSGAPTHGPRIGLAGALTLAPCAVRNMVWASLFHWDTLIIDYLWFAMLVVMFLGGTIWRACSAPKPKAAEHR